jgi:hypothetical protein
VAYPKVLSWNLHGGGHEKQMRNVAHNSWPPNWDSRLLMWSYFWWSYGGVGVYLHLFLTLPLDRDVWSPSRSVRFTSGKHQYALSGTLGRPQSRFGCFGREKTLISAGSRTRFLGCPASSLLIAWSEYLLSCPGSILTWNASNMKQLDRDFCVRTHSAMLQIVTYWKYYII